MDDEKKEESKEDRLYILPISLDGQRKRWHRYCRRFLLYCFVSRTVFHAPSERVEQISIKKIK